MFSNVSQLKHRTDKIIYIKRRNITKNLVRKTKYNFFENLFSKDNNSKKRLFEFVSKIKYELKATKVDISNQPIATQIKS